MRTERTTRWQCGYWPEKLWCLGSRALLTAMMLSALYPARATADSSRASFVQVVNQANPELRWAAPAPIAYGETLTSQQLSATASVAGTFTYSPAQGTVLQPGTQTLSVVFQPGSSNFKSAATSVEITVMPPNGGTFTVTPGTPSNSSNPGQPTGRVNVSPGSPGVITLVLSPSGDFSGDVTLSCVTPATLRCVFVPAVVPLGAVSRSVILTVNIVPPAGAGPQPGPYPREQPGTKVLPSAAFSFGVALLGWRCRRYRRTVLSTGALPAVLTVLTVLTVAIGLAGCAGADGFFPVQIMIVAKAGNETRSLPLTVFVYQP